jgi:hypothetical protein
MIGVLFFLILCPTHLKAESVTIEAKGQHKSVHKHDSTGSISSDGKPVIAPLVNEVSTLLRNERDANVTGPSVDESLEESPDSAQAPAPANPLDSQGLNSTGGSLSAMSSEVTGNLIGDDPFNWIQIRSQAYCADGTDTSLGNVASIRACAKLCLANTNCKMAGIFSVPNDGAASTMACMYPLIPASWQTKWSDWECTTWTTGVARDTFEFITLTFTLQREMQICSTATTDLTTGMTTKPQTTLQCAELCMANSGCATMNGWFQHDRTTGDCKYRASGAAACSFSNDIHKDYWQITKPEYILEKFRMECNDNSAEVNMGAATNAKDCAAKCKANSGCGGSSGKGTFIYGTGSARRRNSFKGASCWSEMKTTAECSTWDQGDAYDFYTLTNV